MTLQFKTPVKALIQERFLYNINDSRNFLPAEIIGVSAYKNSPLTFTVLVKENGSEYLFSDIPLIGLHPKNSDIVFEKEVDALSREELLQEIILGNNLLSYLKCPSSTIEVFQLDHLKSKRINYFNPATKKWYEVDYLCSIEFVEDNELVHLVKTQHNFMLAPNHKLSIGSQNNFPKYLKNRIQW